MDDSAFTARSISPSAATTFPHGYSPSTENENSSSEASTVSTLFSIDESNSLFSLVDGAGTIFESALSKMAAMSGGSYHITKSLRCTNISYHINFSFSVRFLGSYLVMPATRCSSASPTGCIRRAENILIFIIQVM